MTDKREFEIVYDTELPGTPERVWEAVTAGTPAWMFPTDQWPAVKTVEEFPHHLVSRMDGPDGWFNQLEHVLEPLDGGRARLHYVFTDIQAPAASQTPDGFVQLRRALGIEQAGQGSQVELELDGVGRLSGEVDFANEHFLGIRTSDALYRFFGRNAFGAPVGMTVHDFSGAGDPETTAKAWGNFLEKAYA
jgi:hypothetical protein